MCSSTLWSDEAESSINALTILEHGLPTSTYLGQPIYENTLTEFTPDDAEYEFRDSSYSDEGLVIYHGWLPLYSIAAAQALAGIRPDMPSAATAPQHGKQDIFRRSIVPRIPAIIFSGIFLFTIYTLVRSLSGETAGLIALSWLAFSRHAIRFGSEARYYSLTLCMSAICAYTAWKLYRKGRWQDYILLGIAEGMLFHTHQLSAVVFAITCLVLTPRILQHKLWLGKSAVAASIALGLTLPWVLATGFLESAATLPKGYELFDSWQSWFTYVQERPKSALITLGLAAGLICLLALEKFKPRHEHKNATYHIPIYCFIIIWIGVAYSSFQLLVPSASFFFERLTLMALTPIAIFTAMVCSEFIKFLNGRIRIPVALGCVFTLLFVTKDMSRLYDRAEGIEDGIAEVFAAIESTNLQQPYRIYASPGSHLVLTYYAGLPVQSICPIRKDYLNSYPHDILFIEESHVWASPSDNEIRSAAQIEGVKTTPDIIEQSRQHIRSHLIGAALNQRGLTGWKTTVPALPSFLQPIFQETLIAETQASLNYLEASRKLPIFKGVQVESARDLWLSFFYRFSNYEDRIGEQANILPIQRESTIRILPRKGYSLYFRQAINNKHD